MRYVIWTLTAMSLCTVQTVASAQIVKTFKVERDNLIEEAHKPNNDGSWGYGWIKVSQGAHNYGLLGFDLRGLIALTDPVGQIVSATLILRVGQNHFAEDGKTYNIHRWDPSAGVSDWVEGKDRWDLFSYCSKSVWSRPADAIGGEGSTWTCSNDPAVRDGSVACATPTPGTTRQWAPALNGGVHAGFDPTPTTDTFEKKQSTNPAADCPNLLPQYANNCNPLCGNSLECLDAGYSVEQCYRKVTFDLTGDVEQFVANGVAHPSWLIKRADNSGAGAFHYFSREGATCILGNCGQGADYEKYKDLQPVLEVVLTDEPPGTIVDPPLHCEALCPTPTP